MTILLAERDRVIEVPFPYIEDLIFDFDDEDGGLHWLKERKALRNSTEANTQWGDLDG